MRVLWFAHTPSNFFPGDNAYNGWVSALEEEICGRVELGLSFMTRTHLPEITSAHVNNHGRKVQWAHKKKHGVDYYPVFNGYDSTPKERLLSYIRGDEIHYHDLVEAFVAIVDDFKPDVIEVFGSEHSYGLVAEKVSVPVVLHIQGVMNPYYTHFLPPKISWGKYIWTPLRLKSVLMKIFEHKKMFRASLRETRIFKAVNYYLGRTEWDHRQVRRINHDARFFYGGEILRRPFYDADIESISSIPSTLKLVSTISGPPYKGYDLILRSAKLLKEMYMLDFEWKVYGKVEPKFYEKITGIRTEDVGVTLSGVASAEELVDAIAKASMYVHPSYIDNSPNSVCEAQLLGAAVVATSVGGVPSLIEDGQTGFMVRKGDPDEIAERVVALYRNKALLRKVGRQAREAALVRHDKSRITEDLLEVYDQLVAH